MSMSIVCAHCGCSEVDVDQTRGDTVCTKCGSVLDDQCIVSELQFQETAAGGFSAVGQFVSCDGGKELSLGSTFQHGLGRESKAETLQKAKRRIQNLCGILKLNQHCVDTAMNFFKMAYFKKLTRTRKSSHVVAACVYLVCRTEGLPHMLLDISDALQVNVYTLGRTYLILSKQLCINIPAIDPCHYIPRFAHKLEFHDKTHEVSMTALRLVQRMKRDWMSTGRRPSGLCGAALLFSARIHNFSRSVKDIIKVVKVCRNTIKKRLYEFSATPTSNLTIDEFQRIDLETEHDPPAYTEGKIKAKLMQLEESKTLSEITTEIGSLQEQIEKSLYKSCQIIAGKTNGVTSEVGQPRVSSSTNNDPSLDSNDPSLDSNDPSLDPTVDTAINEMENEQMQEILRDTLVTATGQNKIPPRPTAASLGIKQSVKECLTVQDISIENETGELDLTGIDDAELDKFILTEEESRVKTAIWMAENADYLKYITEKAEREIREAEENPKKKKKTRKNKTVTEAKTYGEALEQVLQHKKISNKINYEVLKDLDTELSASTPYKSNSQSNVTEKPFFRFKKPKVIYENLNYQCDNRPPKRHRITPALSPTKKSRVNEISEVLVNISPIVVETGPIEYATNDGLDDEVGVTSDMDEGDEPVNVSAQLFGNTNYEEEAYYQDYDDGD